MVASSTGASSCATAELGDSGPAGAAACWAELLPAAAAAPAADAGASQGEPSNSSLRFMMLFTRSWGVGAMAGLLPSLGVPARACCGVAASASASRPAAALSAGLMLSPCRLSSPSEVYFLASSLMDSGTEAEERRFQDGERTAPARDEPGQGGLKVSGSRLKRLHRSQE